MQVDMQSTLTKGRAEAGPATVRAQAEHVAATSPDIRSIKMARLDENPLVANYDGLFCEASGFGRARRVTLLECLVSLCGLSASSANCFANNIR
jgi:hypothetical protein